MRDGLPMRDGLLARYGPPTRYGGLGRGRDGLLLRDGLLVRCGRTPFGPNGAGPGWPPGVYLGPRPTTGPISSASSGGAGAQAGCLRGGRRGPWLVF